MADEDNELRQARLAREADEATRDYSFTFNSPHGRRVVAHLIPFCCGDRTTKEADIYATMINEGRRQVLIRIMQFANLNGEEIFKIIFDSARAKGIL